MRNSRTSSSFFMPNVHELEIRGEEMKEDWNILSSVLGRL